MHIRLEYEDHNEEFAPYFPLRGNVVQSLTSTSGTKGWFLVDLDEGIEYQVETDVPFQYRLIKAHKLLIRSRLIEH